MNVATRTSPPVAGLRATPLNPLSGTPCAVSGAAATLAVDTIGLGDELTGPVDVTLIVVPATVVVPVLPRSVSVTSTV